MAKSKPLPPSTEPPLPESRSLLVIDQAPLYEDAQRACQEAWQRIQALKAELLRFETQDCPNFSRWYNSTFGALLTETREAANAFHTAEYELNRARQAHWKKFFGNSSGMFAETECGHSEYGDNLTPEDAANSPTRRRGRFRTFEDAEGNLHAVPDDGEDEDVSDEGGESGGTGRGGSDRESRSGRGGRSTSEYGGDGDTGDDNDDDYDGEYGPGSSERQFQDADGFYDDEREENYGESARSARRFEEEFLRGNRSATGRAGGFNGDFRRRAREAGEDAGPRSGPDPRQSQRPGGRDGNGRGPGARAAGKNGEWSESQRARLKERYRILVRKLHPDLNPELTADQRALWNRVQVAYHARDLEQLDVLITLANAFGGRFDASGGTEATSLTQMRRAAREIQELGLPLERKLEDARRQRAWNFTQVTERHSLQEAITRELRLGLFHLRDRLTQALAQITRYRRSSDRPG